jgi:hypothetical protein
MARHEKLFVGPYAEWVAHQGLSFKGDSPRWDELLDGGELEWNIGNSGWSVVRRGDQVCELLCCMPLKPRLSCPRWPMFLEWRWGNLCPGGMECVTDWTALDRDAEIAWFAAAFAKELRELAALVGEAPSLRWGLINWVLD